MPEQDLSKVPERFKQSYREVRNMMPDLFIGKDAEKEAENDWAILTDEQRRGILALFYFEKVFNGGNNVPEPGTKI
jgi:hypothetical protein